ncbi:helix-turn-helix domain-containing protein [Micromonospora sp. CPCC 205539]|uniref:helix-turn-helix domain-containing protein n=1 Tax=Micromonospora sp. CPCC 205539 TaxID=3122408 RepID=UPI002FF0E6E0
MRSSVHHGHNHRQPALELHIHRNTRDYRHQRIATLTGLDPASPAEVRILDAAPTATELRQP